MTSSTGSSLSAYCCTVHWSKAIDVVAGPGLGLGGHGDVDLVADARKEVELNGDLVLFGPVIDQFLHGGIAGGNPVVPQREAQLACGAGGANVHQGQRGRGGAQFERGSASDTVFSVAWPRLPSRPKLVSAIVAIPGLSRGWPRLRRPTRP